MEQPPRALRSLSPEGAKPPLGAPQGYLSHRPLRLAMCYHIAQCVPQGDFFVMRTAHYSVRYACAPGTGEQADPFACVENLIAFLDDSSQLAVVEAHGDFKASLLGYAFFNRRAG